LYYAAAAVTLTYVYAREARESFIILDCLGVWSTINEECGVPNCYYYMQREDMHLDGCPVVYIPLDFDKDEESKEEWQRRQLKRRFNEQYSLVLVLRCCCSNTNCFIIACCN
jgi:hypothetical protein